MPDADGRAGPPGRLAGGRVVVIGAGTQRTDDPEAPMGNGRAISLLASREGAAVACVDRDEQAAADTAALIEKEGGTAAVIVADVSRPDDCAALVASATEALGGIDGLVLNV